MVVCFCVFPFFFTVSCGCGVGRGKNVHVTLHYVRAATSRKAWGGAKTFMLRCVCTCCFVTHGVGWGHNFHAALLMYVQTIDRVCVWLNLKSWLPPKLQAVKVSILWVNSGCVVKVVCLALPKRWWHTLWDCWKSTTDERLPLKKEVVYGCLRQFKSNKDVCFPQ